MSSSCHVYGQPRQYNDVLATLHRERLELLRRVEVAELAVNTSRELTGSLYNRIETFKALKARNRGA